MILFSPCSLEIVRERVCLWCTINMELGKCGLC